jgi:hypothetical protein
MTQRTASAWKSLGLLLAVAGLAWAGAEKAEDKIPDTPWPAEVPDFKAPEPGEHPRLFFRKADLQRVKARAATPEGQAIVKRLRFLLNGGDGQTLPAVFNDSKECTDATCVHLKEPAGQAYTLWHGAGYGMLFQLTGEQKYADLGRQAVEKALGGTRDRDGRYSFVMPNGALRAGPAIGAIAMAYDLCYDGWEQDFRKKVALALLNYNAREHCSLLGLVCGERLGPTSNHCGPQIGGGALVCLAVMNDPGVDQTKVAELLKESKKAVLMQLTQGWGMYGHYCQGDGAGAISSDTAFLPGLQAWRTAGGKDFITPRPVAQWMTLKWIIPTVAWNGQGQYPGRGMYTHNCWSRTGLSGAGTFSQGFGTISDEYKPALLWLYNHYFKAADEKAGAPCDTVSAYPHRCVLALVNWPSEMEEKNPAEFFPLADMHRHYCLRNRWQDEMDIVVSLKPSLYDPITVYAYGTKLSFGKMTGATFTYCREFPDGSAIVSAVKGGRGVAVDFSKATGADMVMVLVGKGATGGKDNALKNDATCKFSQLKAGDTTYDIRTIQVGAPPEVKEQNGKVLIGGKTLYFDGDKLVLEHLNAADAKKG